MLAIHNDRNTAWRSGSKVDMRGAVTALRACRQAARR